MRLHSKVPAITQVTALTVNNHACHNAQHRTYPNGTIYYHIIVIIQLMTTDSITFAIITSTK